LIFAGRRSLFAMCINGVGSSVFGVRRVVDANASDRRAIAHGAAIRLRELRKNISDFDGCAVILRLPKDRNVRSIQSAAINVDIIVLRDDGFGALYQGMATLQSFANAAQPKPMKPPIA
jgi:hypothetical protein